MWNPENRKLHDRSALRYPSDLTDEEWNSIQPLIPPARRGGRRREVNVREVVNGVMYMLSTGCQWRALPKDLPPRSTVWSYLDLWDYDGTLDRIHDELYVRWRKQEGGDAGPAATVIDSRKARSAGKGGPRSTRLAMSRIKKARTKRGASL